MEKDRSENDELPVVDCIQVNIDIRLPVKQKPKAFIESTDFLCQTMKEFLEHWLCLCCDGQQFATLMSIDVHVKGVGPQASVVPPSNMPS